MEEFLKSLTEQIRCVKARDGVAKEMMDHIQDQTDCYEESGMSHEAAVTEAVRQMGDPVAIGMELDRIHRPKTDWTMLIMVALFNIAGIIVLYATGVLRVYQGNLGRQCFFAVLGFAVMIGIYFLDYSFWGKYAVYLYWGMLAVFFFYEKGWAYRINGQARGMTLPMYLFIPIYAGILYQYRGKRYAAVVKSILYMLPPAFFSLRMIPSLPTAMNLLFIMCCMLLLAVWKKWFLPEIVKTAPFLLFLGVILSIGFAFYFYHFQMADYQIARIKTFFGEGELSYLQECLQMVLKDSQWIGAVREVDMNIVQNNRQVMSANGLVITQIISSYGVFFGALAVLSFVLLLSRMFHIVRQQKNQLGFMMGAGCGLVFLVMVVQGVFMNFGMFPFTTIILPFLTYGGTAAIVYHILLGILLSIYRYQNVLCDKTMATGHKWQYTLKIEKVMKN